MPVTKLYATLSVLVFWLLASAAATELTPPEQTALRSTAQGEVVVLTNLWSHQRDLPSVQISISANLGPQLLLSDKPEYFYTGNGIAMQETVKAGVVRLYIYHVPEPTNGPKTISAVLENLGPRPLKFQFLHRAFPRPGKDYHRIGKTGLIDFFNSVPDPEIRRVPPHARIVIDPQMDATTVKTDELVHGFYEFKISQPARITTFQRDPAQSSLTAIDDLPRLPYFLPGHPANGAGRGLFLTNDFTVLNAPHTVIDTAQCPRRLVLADGRRDPSITGTDEFSETNFVHDGGNYGALYHLRLKYTSSDGRGLALLMTKPAMGGKWCSVQAAAVRINNAVFPGGTVALPANRVTYGDPGEMVLIQKFPPPKNGRTALIEILYSPPGASCIPTPFIFVPY